MDEIISDRELIKLFLSRDDTALELAMKKYKNRLMRFASRFLEDERDSEECVNDAFWKAWKSIPPQQPDDLFPYLARLCRFTAYDLIEKKNTAKRSALMVELTREMEECIPDIYAETDMKGEELTVLLDEFLKTLTQSNRAIFIRRYWFGESVGDIAKRFSFSESKVKTSLHRTRNKLKDTLSKKGVSV